MNQRLTENIRYRLLPHDTMIQIEAGPAWEDNLTLAESYAHQVCALRFSKFSFKMVLICVQYKFWWLKMKFWFIHILFKKFNSIRTIKIIFFFQKSNVIFEMWQKPNLQCKIMQHWRKINKLKNGHCQKTNCILKSYWKLKRKWCVQLLFIAFVSRNGEGNQSNDLDLSHGQPLPSLRQLWQSDLQLLWEV